MKDWNIKELTGYEPETTYYSDFSIAERFGISAIKDTYRQAFKYCKGDYALLTELVMVLNWKTWEHNETKPVVSKIYYDLWEKTDKYACENLKGKELQYFYRTTD